jgi:hypothetical protein
LDAEYDGVDDVLPATTQEGRLGLRRTVTPRGGTDAPTKFGGSCLGFGS